MFTEKMLERYDSRVYPIKGTVIICPGGGYHMLAPREAQPVAKAWNDIGYNAFILNYTVTSKPLMTMPLNELAQAVSAVRMEMEQNKLIKSPIAICGFSAGGHLAASLGVLWYRSDLIKKNLPTSCRPDAVVIGYPVVSMEKDIHPASRSNLIGEDAKLADTFSLEKQCTEKSSPMFIWSTFTDEKIPVYNSLKLAESLHRAGVDCELHIFHNGKHGMSIATKAVESIEEDLHPNPHIAHWLYLCDEWLQEIWHQ
jgi:acetyl esterase/lipase